MSGDKIQQARDSMLWIIEKLSSAHDKFNIVKFSSNVESMWDNIRPASADNKSAARSWTTDNIQDGGGTNINSAILEGVDRLKKNSSCGKNIVVLLTDGMPSAGVTDTTEIIANFSKANED